MEKNTYYCRSVTSIQTDIENQCNPTQNLNGGWQWLLQCNLTNQF